MNIDANQLEKRRQVEGLIKFGGLSVTGLIVAPIVFLALKGVVGIIAVGVVALAGWNLIPVVATKLANLSLKSIMNEARKNPIETLELDYVKREKSLEEFRATINNFSASVKNFSDKYTKFKTEFPEDAEKFENQLEKMKKLLDVRRKRYAEAKASLDHYSSEIERAKAIWAMGQEAAKMNAAAGLGQEDFMEKIKTETSIDAVENSMNKAFAELETSLIEEDDEKNIAAHKFPEGTKAK